jgi:hypothetical protein
MRAILALAFIGAVAASTTLQPALQEYHLFYTGTGCSAANVVYIGQVDSYDWSCTPTACTDNGSGTSQQNVCLNGNPKNLGVRLWQMWGTCDAATLPPFVDYYLPSLTGTNRQVYDIETWKVGCQPDTYWDNYFNFIDAPAAGGAFVNYNGDCGTVNTCTQADCPTADYSLATGTAGCDTATTSSDNYLETTQVFPTATAAADYFEIDYSLYVFADKYPSTCCKITGDCNCCVADGDSCCNPSSLDSTYNTCCDDNTAVENNTLSMQLFQACLCDQNGEERGTYDSSTNVCTLDSTTLTGTGNVTLTEDTAESACDFLKVYAWCNAHALQDSQYYEDIGNTDAWDANEEVVGETDYYYIGSTGASDEATGADPCFTFAGNFQPSANVGTLYDLNLVDFCDLGVEYITAAGFECDAFCASGNTLAFAALLAFF